MHVTDALYVAITFIQRLDVAKIVWVWTPITDRCSIFLRHTVSGADHASGQRREVDLTEVSVGA